MSNRKIYKLISCLILCTLIIDLFPKSSVYASNWVIADSNTDIQIDNKNKALYWDRVHYSGDDNDIRYRTIGYKVSSVTYRTGEKNNSSYNSSFKNCPIIIPDKKNVSSTGGIKTIRYTITQESLLSAARQIGVTPEDMANGTAIVYLNPVFETYKGDVIRKTNIWGCIEVQNAESWSSSTHNNFPNLYNVKCILTISNLYDVRVVAEDNKGNNLQGAKTTNGVTVNSVISDSKQLYYGYYYNNYTLPATYQTLTKNGTTYKYSKWYYTYDKRNDSSSNPVKITGDGSTKPSFSGPDAEGGSVLTVHMVYEPQEPNTFSVNVVLKSGTKTLSTIEAAKSARGGTAFNYNISATYRAGDGTDYSYIGSCDVSYKANGSTKTESVNAVSKITHTLPNADKNSIVTFVLYYAKGPVPPTPTPTPSAPTPTPPIPEVVVPEPDYASLEYTFVNTEGIIEADIKNTQRFIARQGIPTTESLYAEAKATEYIVGYNFIKRVGMKSYPVTVRKEYIYDYPDPVEDESVVVEQTFTVNRAYGYWEIIDFGLYEISNAVFTNAALPGGSVTITPNPSLYSTPSAYVSHYSSESYHLTPPIQATTGITLPSETIPVDDKMDKPSLPEENFEWYALSMTDQITVRNDTVVWNGTTVMDGSPVMYDTYGINSSVIRQCTSMTKDNALYRSGLVIEATKNNGDYGSTGTITYSAKACVNRSSTMVYGMSVNNVIIHTPVYCDGIMTADNDRWVQLLNPTEGAVALVLDEDNTLNDFTIRISNTGTHSPRLGYYYRDLAWCLRDTSISYMARKNGVLRNEVRFPFDVYQDVNNDGVKSNDKFIRAGTWLTIGHTEPRFYLPMWVQEGVYDVECRSVAVNVGDRITYTQVLANTNRAYYVATDTIRVEVSGRMYGLTIYDLSDYPIWENVFRAKNSSILKINQPDKYPSGTNSLIYNALKSYDYTVGTCDQYGNPTGRNSKYTFPLVNGSHAEYKNQGILKTGYMVRFKLTTIGEMYSDACKVVVVPTFYHVDNKGQNRQMVDLWYSEEIYGKNQNLVKVGSSLDLSNIKYQTVGDLNFAIPENELRTTADIRNEKYGTYIWIRSALFNFSKITIPYYFRTFTNTEYLSAIKALPSYSDVRDYGIKDNTVVKTKQNWYGEYYIPNNVHVAPAGTDVLGYSKNVKGIDYTESFWLKDGYIIVNFNIYTVDSHGQRRLSYTNKANYQNYLNGGTPCCSMWIKENPTPSKKDYSGTTFDFYAGDFIMYYVKHKAGDDYKSKAIY